MLLLTCYFWLTLTLDVFKCFSSTSHLVASLRLTLTLDVFKLYQVYNYKEVIMD